MMGKVRVGILNWQRGLLEQQESYGASASWDCGGSGYDSIGTSVTLTPHERQLRITIGNGAASEGPMRSEGGSGIRHNEYVVSEVDDLFVVYAVVVPRSLQ